MLGSRTDLGVVGQLQFDVLQSRSQNEYGVPVMLEQSPFELARWISADDPAKLQKFVDAHRGEIATDRDGAHGVPGGKRLDAQVQG